MPSTPHARVHLTSATALHAFDQQVSTITQSPVVVVAMGVIGLSLLVASVVLFCLRPPQWLPRLFANLRQQQIAPPPRRPPVTGPEDSDADDTRVFTRDEKDKEGGIVDEEPVEDARSKTPVLITQEEEEPSIQVTASDDTRPDTREQEVKDEEPVEEEPAQEATPIILAPIIQEPSIQVTTPSDPWPASEASPIPSMPIIHEPSSQVTTSEEREDHEEQPTPKAAATTPADSVPSLVLSESSQPSSDALPAMPSSAFPSLSTSPTSTTPFKFPEIRQPTTPSLVLPKTSTPTFSTPSKVSELRQPSRKPTPPSRIPSPPKVAGRSTSPRRDISPRRAKMTPEQQQIAERPAPPSFTTTTTTPAPAPAPSSSSMMMPPPPIPKKPRPSGIPQLAGTTPSSSSSSPRRIPTLDPTPNRERNLPVPRRGAPSSSSLGGGLAPPPTHSSIPKKPSRQVTLEPGHSPMDWARLAQSPTSDLRGLPPNTPYLRVTLSMLKQMNGRKGRDAWSVYGGKVYNVSPYIKFHPGGAGELLRGAGKDATRLFGEVHPWVNYETMLSACLIGIFVEEHETENKMEEMD